MSEQRASRLEPELAGVGGHSSVRLDVPVAVRENEPSDVFDERLRALNIARQRKLAVGPGMPIRVIEQYRRLAGSLHQAQAARGIKTVMVASAFEGEGKSLTAINLALTLSESYCRRVLLVDADLRRPALHDAFEIPNREGIADWLKSNSAGHMPVVEITRNLTLLPGGRPTADPMSALASERMRQALMHASERFDWVIVDTPPVASLPDGNLLSAMVDAVVFVVGAGLTPAVAAQRAVQELGRDRIIGVVLNLSEPDALDARKLSSYYVQHSAIAGGVKEPDR